MELAENGTVVYHWGLLRFFISLVSGVLQSLSHGQPLEDWPRCFECPTEHPQTGGWYSWLLADSGRIYDMSKVPWLFHVLDVFPLSFTSKNWCQVVPGEFFGIAKETWSPDKGYVQIILQKSISTICTSGRAIGNNQELRTTRKKKNTDSIWSMSRLWSNIGSGRLKQKNLINLHLMLEILKLQKRFPQNDYHISIPSPNHEIGNVYRSSQS